MSKLDYTLLNKPTELLERLEAAEQQLQDIERAMLEHTTKGLSPTSFILRVRAILNRSEDG